MNVARFFAKRVAQWPSPHAMQIEVREVNGLPAIIGRSSERVRFVINLETNGEQIVAIRSMLNPDKLNLRQVN